VGQITHPLTTDRPSLPGWNFTSRFIKKRRLWPIIDRLNQVRKHFPELRSVTITVGVSVSADGKAAKEVHGVWFRSRTASRYTIAHEFIHLLQGRKGIPSGERSCDLFTMARHVSFCDQAPNYLKIPHRLMDGRRYFHPWVSRRAHKLAIKAIAMRKKGHRQYIAWFEKELKKLHEPGRRRPPVSQKSPGRICAFVAPSLPRRSAGRSRLRTHKQK
jgi:hypothetical protein